MKKYFLIGLLASIILSCNKTNDMDLNLSLIHQGNLYGNGDENISEENFVIKKEADWLDLLDKIDGVNNTSDNFSETDIDFDEFIVVACFDKIRPSGGYSIAITETEIKKKEVEFTINKEGTEGMAITVMTQPYYIAKLPKTSKKIAFKE